VLRSSIVAALEEREVERPHEISVVIPVYQGEMTLPHLVRELALLAEVNYSSDAYPFVVREVLLVSDRGPDDSPRVMRELAEQYPMVRLVWLSRNYGQHAATLAGMASSGYEWIVTLDEDGQHNRHRDAGTGRRRLCEAAQSSSTRIPEKFSIQGSQVGADEVVQRL
jgi:hypothetical protein